MFSLLTWYINQNHQNIFLGILDISLKQGYQWFYKKELLITVASMSFMAFHFMLHLLSCMNDKDK